MRLVYFCKAALRSYIRTTNLSSTATHSTAISCDDALRTFSTGVSYENKFHTSQAIFFPRPLKDEKVSHPFGAWNIDRVEALSGPRDIAGIFCTFFRDP